MRLSEDHQSTSSSSSIPYPPINVVVRPSTFHSERVSRTIVAEKGEDCVTDAINIRAQEMSLRIETIGSLSSLSQFDAAEPDDRGCCRS